MIGGSADLRRLRRAARSIPATRRARRDGRARRQAGISDLVRNVRRLVAANRRLFALPAMIEAFLAELARRRGETARPGHRRASR